MLKAIQHMAIFMAFLVITIPFCTSIAFASTTGTLSGLEIHGKDNINNVVSASDDYIFMSVEASVKDDGRAVAINGNNLRLVTDKEERFNNCTEISGGTYKCDFKSRRQDRAPKYQEFNLKLYDNTFIMVKNINSGFAVDGYPPEIRSYELSDNEYISSSDFIIEYDIADKACSDCSTDICAGISKLEIYANEELKGTVSLSNASQAGSCILKSEYKGSPAKLNLEEGELELCMRAYDKMGFYDEECKSIGVDFTQPVIRKDSFMLVDSNDAEVTHSSAGARSVLARAVISDNLALNKNKVIGDFSSLNPSRESEYKSLEAECKDTDGHNYTCIWEITVEDALSPAAISMAAYDMAGNKAELSRQLSLEPDDSAPVVHSIYTGAPDSTYIRKAGNTVIAEISDDGSGVDGRKVYMNLAEMSPGLSNERAGNCTGTGNIWKCYWDGIDAGQMIEKAKVNVWITSLEDDAGNYVQDLTGGSAVFTYDGEVPVFTNITVLPKGALRDVLLASDDEIAEVTAYIKESNSGIAAAYADFRQMTSAYSGDIYKSLEDIEDNIEHLTEAESCDPYEGDNSSGAWVCKWDYPGPFSPKTDIKLSIAAVDNAGNVKDSSDDNVYGKAYVAETQEKAVDYWEDEADSGSIPTLNRNIVWMSPGGTYERVEFDLVSRGANPYIHSVEISSCKGRAITKKSTAATNDSDAQGYESYSIRHQSYLPGMPKSNKLLVLNIPNYEKSIIGNATEIEVLCEGEIIQSTSRKGKVFVPYEAFNLSFEIPLGALSFSDPGKETIDKINEKKDTIESLDNYIKWIEAITSFLEPMCKTLNNIRLIITTATSIMASVAILYPPAEGAYKAIFNVQEFINKIWVGNWSPKGAEASGDGESLLGNMKVNAKGYSVASMGFVCDLTLCDSCSKAWDNKVLEKTGLENWVWKDKKGTAYGGDYVDVFDPKKSLVVAVVCWPPCLTGILSKLKAYKAILVTYNVCINIANVKGDDISQCDTYLDSQICQQILGEFWYVLQNLLTRYIVSALMYAIKEKLFESTTCNQELNQNPHAWPKGCGPYRIYIIMDTIIKLGQFVTLLDSTFDFNIDSSSTESGAREHVEQNYVEQNVNYNAGEGYLT